jgi:hypothetical protein
MPLGTPYISDLSSSSTNGVTSALSAAQVNTAFGAGNCRTSSVNFAFHYKGHTITFPKGVPVPVDAALAAALTAAGAPVT